MTDTRAKELVQQADKLFSKRGGLHQLWQAIAENFYIERADFTHMRTEGAEFADHLFGSFPVFARRELGNLFAAMLRPRSVKWFSLHVADEDMDEEQEVRQFLEYMDGVQWRAMYDPASQFVPTTRTADHDFAAFGNAVIEAGLNSTRSSLLYRTHHIRDCAWSENADGEVDTLYRKWKPTARQLIALYPKTVSAETKKKAEKEPECEVEVCHVVVPERTYHPDSKPGKRTLPFTCMYVEKASETVLEETPEAWFRFVVPRWQRVSGSQYARSPATEIVLPDARTFQVVIRTLREAGEMAVNPPMMGVMDRFRSDAQLFPGGFTNVTDDFEGELDNVMRPVYGNSSSPQLQAGFEIAAALRDDIRLGFFLDKIKLPEVDSRAMTAYEVQKRLEEHIRSASPLFEPIEDEYNSRLCNLTFQILQAEGAFGPKDSVPEILSGQQVEFQLRSPLREVQEEAKAGLLMHGLQTVVLPAMQIDPAQIADIDITKAKRDALRGLRWPADWMKDAKLVEEAQAAVAEQRKMQAGIEALGAGGAAAKAVGEGVQSFNGQNA